MPARKMYRQLNQYEGAVFLERAKLIHRYGAAMIVMAFDEKDSLHAPEKVNICVRPINF